MDRLLAVRDQILRYMKKMLGYDCERMVIEPVNSVSDSRNLR